MGMFDIDNTVPDSMALPAGKRRVNIAGVEEKVASTGTKMISLKLTVPTTDEGVAKLGLSKPLPIFDNLFPENETTFCKMRWKQFLTATKVASNIDLLNLVGKSVEVMTKVSRDGEDKPEIAKYLPNSLADGIGSEEVPF